MTTGIFSTEDRDQEDKENSYQYLLDIKILPTIRRCPSRSIRMKLRSYSMAKYREGSCWWCPCGRTTSVRSESVLQNSNVSYGNFISSSSFSMPLLRVSGLSPDGRDSQNIGEYDQTLLSAYQTIREQIAADVRTSSKIGRPGTIEEVDKAKFGKLKYNRGRLVQGFLGEYNV